jgi:uncharacterized integral membrane protein
MVPRWRSQLRLPSQRAHAIESRRFALPELCASLLTGRDSCRLLCVSQTAVCDMLGWSQGGLSGARIHKGVIMAQQDPIGSSKNRAGLSGGAITSLVGGGLLLIFIIQNTQTIKLHFLVWHFSWPLWWYTIITAVFGALVWLGLGVMRRHRRRQGRREARRAGY